VPLALQAALLGVVQGLTEFLPVSSSAHLILARAFFGFDAAKFGLPFDVACHVGTTLAVMVFFRADLARMIAALPRVLTWRSAGERAPDEGARLVWLLVVGTIPAVVAGVLFGDAIERSLRTPQVAAVTLALGAFAFLAAERVGRQDRTASGVSIGEAFWIGCAQALALVPGVSRSGATITMALVFGLDRVSAARFVFVLGIPAILGAAVREAPALLASGVNGGPAGIVPIGLVSSALVGYLAIRFFLQYVGRYSLAVFAWYRLALAAGVVIWLVAGQ
jgi:undecaprenyl-diphosphatase